MNLRKEISFEDEICAHLGANGWLYADGAASHYDPARALYPPDIVAWVKEAQPQAWEAIEKSYGSAAEETLLNRLRDELNKKGTLEVLRRGIEMLGLLEPVADRLLKKYKSAQDAFRAADARGDDKAFEAARHEMDTLVLFRRDAGAFVRLYSFLSQIFDYGNTATEKRAIFFKALLPLLEFGREREGIDLSKVVLTHHNLKNLGKRSLELSGGDKPTLPPITEAGSGAIQDKEKALLAEIIERVNDLFDGELSDQDKLVYVNNVIRGKLLESAVLREQATNNTKEQFANSPDLSAELLNALMGALDAHNAMSTQALNSPIIQKGMKDILLNHAGLWEALRGGQ